MGPCKLDPAARIERTICGCTADTLVARSLVRWIAGGCAAHAEHAFHVVEVAHLVATGADVPYRITDVEKLKVVAKKLGVPVEDRDPKEILKDVAEKALEDYTRTEEHGTLNFLKAYAPKKRIEVFEKLGITPRSFWREIVESIHRTHVGVDSDPMSLLKQGLRTALADAYSEVVATEFQDILFGTPKPVESVANLGVLEPKMVNIVVHGHNPLREGGGSR